MKSMTYTDFRSHLSSALDKVNNDHAPLLITRQSGKPAVVMSLEDFRSYEETARLMNSIRNAARINESILELEGKKASAGSL